MKLGHMYRTLDCILIRHLLADATKIILLLLNFTKYSDNIVMLTSTQNVYYVIQTLVSKLFFLVNTDVYVLIASRMRDFVTKVLLINNRLLEIVVDITCALYVQHQSNAYILLTEERKLRDIGAGWRKSILPYLLAFFETLGVVRTY